MDSALGVLREVGVAPVLLHLGVDEVLVDGRELAGEDLVEQLDDLGVPLHGALLRSAGGRAAGVIRRPAARPGRATTSSASIVGRQPPHRAPAPQRAATSSTSSAPSTISATICRSFTASQWQTSTGTGYASPFPLVSSTPNTSAIRLPKRA